LKIVRSPKPYARSIWMCVSPETSRTLALTIRAMTPAGYAAIAQAGSTGWVSALQSIAQFPFRIASRTAACVYAWTGFSWKRRPYSPATGSR
jgi:hypothetical protein